MFRYDKQKWCSLLYCGMKGQSFQASLKSGRLVAKWC